MEITNMVRIGQRFIVQQELLDRNTTAEIVDIDRRNNETIVELDDFHGALGPVTGRDRRAPLSEIRDAVDPMQIHENRSREARISDASKDAEVTTDPIEWATDPSRHDFPGVDTGPIFEETFNDDFNEFEDPFL